MTQSSYPKGAASEAALGEREWQQIMRSVGRGILDEGGNPYWLTNRDSVTDTVTIGVDTREGYAAAILDGFLHFMDAPETLSVPPVSTDTVYEVGLVFDPNGVADPVQGPITLTVWTAPADDSGGKSHMPFWRITRKANVALGSSPYEEVRPRCSSVLTVTRKSDLPTSGVVLSDTVALVRAEGAFYRSAVASGTVEWIKLTGGGAEASVTATANSVVQRTSTGRVRSTAPLTSDGLASMHAEDVITWAFLNTFVPDSDPYATGGTSIMRWSNGAGGYVENPSHPLEIANKRYVDDHNWGAGDITSGEFDNARVKGSSKAYSNTNLGSTWTSVAVNSSGNFGRYPSALKYKRNIRAWNPDPRSILEMEPVQYDVRQDAAGASGDSDKGLIGFVADSYVETRRELVLIQDGEVEGFHYHLMPVAQQVVLRYLDRERSKQAEEIAQLKRENERLAFNQNEILAYLGLGTDADGRVIIEGGTAPDNGSEA